MSGVRTAIIVRNKNRKVGYASNNDGLFTLVHELGETYNLETAGPVIFNATPTDVTLISLAIPLDQYTLTMVDIDTDGDNNN